MESGGFARVTAWDARLFGRAFGVAAAAFLLAWLITAATDEGGIAWQVRAFRTLPMSPACAAVGTWIALAPARAHGELRAFEALGRAPWATALGASLGGAVMALVAAGAMVSAPSVDVAGFYPIAGHGSAYVYDGAAFVDPAQGYRIEQDGRITQLDAEETRPSLPDPIPPHGRAAAALATALAGVALPLLVGLVVLGRPAPDGGGVPREGARLGPASVGRAVLGVFVTVALSIVLFHAAAALRLPALVAPLPAAALFVLAVVSLVPRDVARPSSRARGRSGVGG